MVTVVGNDARNDTCNGKPPPVSLGLFKFQASGAETSSIGSNIVN